MVVALAEGGRRWPKMVNGGRRVQQRERERARETSTERDVNRWPEEKVAWWLHWPEDVDGGRRVWWQ